MRYTALLMATMMSTLPGEASSAPEVVSDARDVCRKQSHSKWTLETATAGALRAFTSEMKGSGAGHDSPLALLISSPEVFGLSVPTTPEAASGALRELLSSDPQAQIVLLTERVLQIPEYRYLPEYGESIEENWVFRIRLPNTLNVLIWAVVPEAGYGEPYAYTYE